MTIYYISHALILLYGSIFNNSRIRLLTLIGVQLVIIAGLRHYSVGVDIEGYLRDFDYISRSDWENIFIIRHEPGYLIINKLISYILDNPQLFLGLMAMITIWPVLYVVNKYSRMPALSMYLYCSFGFYVFSLSGIRSAIATSLIFLSYLFIIERKPFNFLLLVLTASMIHTSALICLALYPFLNRTLNPAYLFFLFIFFMGLWVIKLPFIQVIVEFIKPNYAAMIIESNSITFFVVILIMFVGCFIILKGVATHNRSVRIMLNIMLFAVFSQMFATVSSNIVRITHFFFIASVLLIPEIIYRVKSKEAKLLISVFVIAMSTLFFAITTVGSNLRVDEYLFFWQDL